MWSRRPLPRVALALLAWPILACGSTEPPAPECHTSTVIVDATELISVETTPSAPATLPATLVSSVGDGDTCPEDMARVEGDHCPQLRGGERRCMKWLDPEQAVTRRCARYSEDAECAVPERRMKFCIDRDEYTGLGQTIPRSDVSWREATRLCNESSKRLCGTDEWTFACEGPDWLPYPYGYERRSDLCHIDQYDLLEKGKLIDQRRPVTEDPGCVSAFGVHNMTGNVGEWTHDPRGVVPFRSAGKGGWWGPLRNRCRATTVGHDEHFHQVQIGFRCCSDVRPSPKLAAPGDPGA